MYVDLTTHGCTWVANAIRAALERAEPPIEPDPAFPELHRNELINLANELDSTVQHRMIGVEDLV